MGGKIRSFPDEKSERSPSPPNQLRKKCQRGFFKKKERTKKSINMYNKMAKTGIYQ